MRQMEWSNFYFRLSENWSLYIQPHRFNSVKKNPHCANGNQFICQFSDDINLPPRGCSATVGPVNLGLRVDSINSLGGVKLNPPTV